MVDLLGCMCSWMYFRFRSYPICKQINIAGLSSVCWSAKMKARMTYILVMKGQYLECLECPWSFDPIYRLLNTQSAPLSICCILNSMNRIACKEIMSIKWICCFSFPSNSVHSLNPLIRQSKLVLLWGFFVFAVLLASMMWQKVPSNFITA